MPPECSPACRIQGRYTHLSEEQAESTDPTLVNFARSTSL
jgi:hypothetical protein